MSTYCWYISLFITSSFVILAYFYATTISIFKHWDGINFLQETVRMTMRAFRFDPWWAYMPSGTASSQDKPAFKKMALHLLTECITPLETISVVLQSELRVLKTCLLQLSYHWSKRTAAKFTNAWRRKQKNVRSDIDTLFVNPRIFILCNTRETIRRLYS